MEPDGSQATGCDWWHGCYSTILRVRYGMMCCVYTCVYLIESEKPIFYKDDQKCECQLFKIVTKKNGQK